MTLDQNHCDLARHEQEQKERLSFNYVLLDTRESAVLGCVYIDPDDEPAKGGRVEVLCTDIELFELEYLDPQTGSWVETWDTTQAAGGMAIWQLAGCSDTSEDATGNDYCDGPPSQESPALTLAETASGFVGGIEGRAASWMRGL